LSNLGGRKVKDEAAAVVVEPKVEVKNDEPVADLTVEKPKDELIVGPQSVEDKPALVQSKGKTKKKKDESSAVDPIVAPEEGKVEKPSGNTKSKKTAKSEDTANLILVNEFNGDKTLDSQTDPNEAEVVKKTKTSKAKKSYTKKTKLTDIESSVESFL
jgi:hypothetical protein